MSDGKQLPWSHAQRSAMRQSSLVGARCWDSAAAVSAPAQGKQSEGTAKRTQSREAGDAGASAQGKSSEIFGAWPFDGLPNARRAHASVTACSVYKVAITSCYCVVNGSVGVLASPKVFCSLSLRPRCWPPVAFAPRFIMALKALLPIVYAQAAHERRREPAAGCSASPRSLAHRCSVCVLQGIMAVALGTAGVFSGGVGKKRQVRTTCTGTRRAERETTERTAPSEHHGGENRVCTDARHHRRSHFPLLVFSLCCSITSTVTIGKLV